MRVLILTPSSFPEISGNAATSERWRAALTKKGVDVRVLAGEGLNSGSFRNYLKRFRPEIIHVHHAFKCGSLLVGLERMETGAIVVASPGGTDINEDFRDPDRRRIVLRVFEMARSIIAQSPQIMQHFKENLPALSDRVVFVPKAVCWFGDAAYDLRGAAGCGPGDILFFHPSGIRPVKGNIECLRNMKRVHDKRPEARLVAAGPAVDEDYTYRFRQEMRSHSDYACWIEAIPPPAMRSAFQAADVVLNTSSSEGLSNSLIEAIAAERPVLASDIQGNRWPILGEGRGASAGLLFDLLKPEDFVEKAVRLIDDADLRAALSVAAKTTRSRWPSVEEEADKLLAAYKGALDGA